MQQNTISGNKGTTPITLLLIGGSQNSEGNKIQKMFNHNRSTSISYKNEFDYNQQREKISMFYLLIISFLYDVSDGVGEILQGVGTDL